MSRPLDLEELFNNLYSEFSSRVGRFCFTLHHLTHVCKDIEQLGWIYVWNNLHKFNEEVSSFPVWSQYHFKNARNQLVREYVVWQHVIQLEGESYLAAEIDDSEEPKELNMSSLKGAHTAILEEHYGAGKKLKEIADEEGRSLSWAHKAHRELKSILKDKPYE